MRFKSSSEFINFYGGKTCGRNESRDNGNDLRCAL